MDETGDGDADDGVEPQHLPPGREAVLAQRQGRRRDRHEEVGEHREVGDEADEPGPERGGVDLVETLPPRTMRTSWSSRAAHVDDGGEDVPGAGQPRGVHGHIMAAAGGARRRRLRTARRPRRKPSALQVVTSLDGASASERPRHPRSTTMTTRTPHADDPRRRRPLVDTSAMPTIHTLLPPRAPARRRPGARASPTATDRAPRSSSDHLDYLRRTLHHHHTVEDELLWPVLLERVPGGAGADRAPHGVPARAGRRPPRAGRRRPAAAARGGRPGAARRARRHARHAATSTSSSTSTPRRSGCCPSPPAA